MGLKTGPNSAQFPARPFTMANFLNGRRDAVFHSRRWKQNLWLDESQNDAGRMKDVASSCLPVRHGNVAAGVSLVFRKYHLSTATAGLAYSWTDPIGWTANHETGVIADSFQSCGCLI